MPSVGALIFLNFTENRRKYERFQAAFVRDFETACGVIGPADAIGREVLARDQLAVALAILQIEWMTQPHYVERVRDDEGNSTPSLNERTLSTTL